MTPEEMISMLEELHDMKVISQNERDYYVSEIEFEMDRVKHPIEAERPLFSYLESGVKYNMLESYAMRYAGMSRDKLLELWDHSDIVERRLHYSGILHSLLQNLQATD